MVIVAAVLVGRAAIGPQGGIDGVRALIEWPPGCKSVDTIHESKSPVLRDWPHAVERASVHCTVAGPSIFYASFDDERALRHDLLAAPPASGLCLVGATVLIDGLDPGQFGPLCRELEGHLVDETVGLPESGGATFEEIDRAIARDNRRASAAQGRALRRLW